MNTQSTEEENRSSAVRASSLEEMKSVLEARVKAQPESAEAWRELAQVKMMLGDIDGAENGGFYYRLLQEGRRGG